jgi:hypothetical protein
MLLGRRWQQATEGSSHDRGDEKTRRWRPWQDRACKWQSGVVGRLGFGAGEWREYGRSHSRIYSLETCVLAVACVAYHTTPADSADRRLCTLDLEEHKSWTRPCRIRRLAGMLDGW